MELFKRKTRKRQANNSTDTIINIYYSFSIEFIPLTSSYPHFPKKPILLKVTHRDMQC